MDTKLESPNFKEFCKERDIKTPRAKEIAKRFFEYLEEFGFLPTSYGIGFEADSKIGKIYVNIDGSRLKDYKQTVSLYVRFHNSELAKNNGFDCSSNGKWNHYFIDSIDWFFEKLEDIF